MKRLNEAALDALSSTSDLEIGLEIGAWPSVVVVDQGTPRTFSTMNAHGDICTLIFSRRALMAGLGLQGTRIAQVPRRQRKLRRCRNEWCACKRAAVAPGLPRPQGPPWSSG